MADISGRNLVSLTTMMPVERQIVPALKQKSPYLIKSQEPYLQAQKMVRACETVASKAAYNAVRKMTTEFTGTRIRLSA